MSVRRPPILYRKITFGDIDRLGNSIKPGSTYLLEKLEPSSAGSVLKAGDKESLTLEECKQPIEKPFGSEGAFNRIRLADGSTIDYATRSQSAMVTETWSFSCEGLTREAQADYVRFLRKVGNHTLIRADDPDGNVIYGKISGDIDFSWFIRYGNIKITVQQEPGVTSL